MAELTNLTDRITHLRDRKGGSPVVRPEKAPGKTNLNRIRERRFATDYFMFAVYTLLSIAILTQFALIAIFDFL